MATLFNKQKGKAATPSPVATPPPTLATMSSSTDIASNHYALSQFTEDKKLDSHNYLVWRARVRTIISYHRLWDWLNDFIG